MRGPKPPKRGGARAVPGPRSARRRRTAEANRRWPERPADRTPRWGVRGVQGQPNGRILGQYRTEGRNGQGTDREGRIPAPKTTTVRTADASLRLSRADRASRGNVAGSDRVC